MIAAVLVQQHPRPGGRFPAFAMRPRAWPPSSPPWQPATCSSPNCNCAARRPADTSYSNASRSNRHDAAGTGPPTATPHPPAPAGARAGSDVCPIIRPTRLLHIGRCNAGRSGHTPPVTAPHLPALIAALSSLNKLLRSAFALSPVTTLSASSCLLKLVMIKLVPYTDTGPDTLRVTDADSLSIPNNTFPSHLSSAPCFLYPTHCFVI